MKNAKSRKELIELIRTDIIGSSNDKFKDFICNELTKENRYSLKEYRKIEQNIIELEQLRPEELLWFIQALEKFDNEKYNAKDYFTIMEIKQYKFYDRDRIYTEDLLVFKDALEIAPNQYQCRMSVEQLAYLNDSGMIRTEPSLQRESKDKRYGNTVLKKVYINRRRVREISNLIAQDRYFYNGIRICEINDGVGQYEYDEVDRTITISKDGDCIVLDGNHRTKAASKAYFDFSEKRELFQQRYFTVWFTFSTPSEAKSIIEQEWNTQPVNASVRRAMKQTTENLIIDDIIRSENAEEIYSKKIVKTETEINAGSGFIRYGFFARAITRSYNLKEVKTKQQRNKITNWLIEFFNELTSLLLDDFINYNLIKKTKWSVNPNAIYGYVLLSERLQNCDDWQDILKKIIYTIDWNNDNMPMKYGAFNKNMVATEKFFEEAYKDVQ